jgi:hypothetical protein
MRPPRLSVPFFLLAILVCAPIAARTGIAQVAPVGGQPLDPEYADRIEAEQRDQRRRDQQGMHENAACELGCSDHEGIQTRAIPGTSLVGVVHQAKLDDDVLTLRFRFYNDGSEPARLTIDPTSAYESYFVQVGREKLFILKNEDGELDAKESLSSDLKPRKMETWWAKFPAPPAGTEAFDLEIPPVASFRNIPLED